MAAPLIAPALCSHRPPPDREKREKNQKQNRNRGLSPSPGAGMDGRGGQGVRVRVSFSGGRKTVMSSKRIRRSNYPRRRRPRGFLWTLLGLFTLGMLTAVLASRRPVFPEDAEPEPRRRRGPEPEPEPLEPEPAAEVPGESLWIAGPAGNLYVRDGGGEERPDALPVLFLHSLAGNGGQWALQLDHLRRHRRAVALDFRGHGESDPAEDGDYSIPGLPPPPAPRGAHPP